MQTIPPFRLYKYIYNMYIFVLLEKQQKRKRLKAKIYPFSGTGEQIKQHHQKFVFDR